MALGSRVRFGGGGGGIDCADAGEGLPVSPGWRMTRELAGVAVETGGSSAARAVCGGRGGGISQRWDHRDGRLVHCMVYLYPGYLREHSCLHLGVGLVLPPPEGVPPAAIERHIDDASGHLTDHVGFAPDVDGHRGARERLTRRVALPGPTRTSPAGGRAGTFTDLGEFGHREGVKRAEAVKSGRKPTDISSNDNPAWSPRCIKMYQLTFHYSAEGFNIVQGVWCI